MTERVFLFLVTALLPAAIVLAADKPIDYQNTPVFPLSVTRVNSADISDILLQYYDTQTGRWVGCGLFQISRTPQGEVRARVNFNAPAEGAYRLRSIARDPAGNVESASDDPDDYHVMAVYDATPPVVEMTFPRGGERIEVPGAVDVRWVAHDQNIAQKSSVRVMWSKDGGITFDQIMPWSDLTEEFKWAAPDISTERAVIAVEVKDLAGNVGRKESGIFALAGSKPAPRPEKDVSYSAQPKPEALPGRRGLVAYEQRVSTTPPAARALARRYYGRGVIYLVRGDYNEAVNELTSALQADPDFVAARVDLGVALAQMGRVRDGLEYLETSAIQYPGEQAFPFNAGLIYYNAGDYKMALEKYRKALAIKPDGIETLWMAADCAIRLGNTGDAARYWLAIVEITQPGNTYHDQARSYLEKLGVNIAAISPAGPPALISEPVTVKVQPPEETAADKAVEEAPHRLLPPPPKIAPEAAMESAGKPSGPTVNDFQGKRPAKR
jgi:Tfp pilus assembly protein PilF